MREDDARKWEDFFLLGLFFNSSSSLSLSLSSSSPNSFEGASDVSRAETDLTTNLSYKAEIDAREDTFNSICAFGERLLREQPGSTAEITARLEELRDRRQQLQQTWKDTQHTLELQRDVLQFERETEIAEAWLATRDALMAASDQAGADDLQGLLLKHNELEASVAAQDARFAALRRLTALEQEKLDKAGIDAFFKRYAEEDAALQAELAELERSKAASQEALRRKAAEQEQLQRQQEEGERRRRAEQAAQQAQQDEARAREMANVILERDRRRSMAYDDALRQARKEAVQRAEEVRREQVAREEREKRAQEARERAQQAAEALRQLQNSGRFLPTPSLSSTTNEELRRASVATSNVSVQHARAAAARGHAEGFADANGGDQSPTRRHHTVSATSRPSVRGNDAEFTRNAPAVAVILPPVAPPAQKAAPAVSTSGSVSSSSVFTAPPQGFDGVVPGIAEVPPPPPPDLPDDDLPPLPDDDLPPVPTEVPPPPDDDDVSV